MMSEDEYNKRREKCIEYKLDATETAFSELENLINQAHADEIDAAKME